jgi:hypothetical protein
VPEYRVVEYAGRLSSGAASWSQVWVPVDAAEARDLVGEQHAGPQQSSVNPQTTPMPSGLQHCCFVESKQFTWPAAAPHCPWSDGHVAATATMTVKRRYGALRLSVHERSHQRSYLASRVFVDVNQGRDALDVHLVRKRSKIRMGIIGLLPN